MSLEQFEDLALQSSATQKMSKYGVFSGPYSVQISENTVQKKFRIWALFMPCCSSRNETVNLENFD